MPYLKVTTFPLTFLTVTHKHTLSYAYYNPRSVARLNWLALLAVLFMYDIELHVL